MKKFYIKTYGCQMNARDSELVVGMLIKHGYKLVDDSKKADIILFNTCSVRQHAEDRVWSEIGSLKKRKRAQGKKPIVCLIGCMAQNFQKKAFARSEFIDLVVGPNNISELPGLIETVLKKQGKSLSVGKIKRDSGVYNTEYIEDKLHCNVIIMEGCNNFCSYCIVPYVRGRERSRPAKDILNEIKRLVAKGVKEITLLGQNVNSYKFQISDSKSQIVEFIDLIKMVNDVEGLKRFGFVTAHPKDASVEMFKAIAALDKCKKSLHLPVQSGSDRILKLMNRKYTRKHYLDLVKKAREIVPGIRLTTDVMVGFPTETDKNFQDTVDLFEDVKFDAAYVFKYSPRPHTKASDMEDDVSMQVKKERNQILLKFQKQLHKKRIDG
ncbi:MAG: tRNA (N6-isopentenyl adenosine(37)-C2)-methylthiotransferase MiaB [PVC group bacterium]|nr:tRNA (N6-isopentenyl adenosine(37)-C2)-methylthiotransferase MiaB [PVC group bacterium]